MGIRLLDTPKFLDKWGLDYELVRGWETRGNLLPAMPKIVIAHHTGGATQAQAAHRPHPFNDYPSLPVVRDGRPDLVGPLSLVGLGFSGMVYVISSGKSNHAGKGYWRGVNESIKTIGIEAESPGDGTWTPDQRKAYPLLCAALLDMLDSTSEYLAAHREWALPSGRKNDPTGWNMPSMRQQVADLLKYGPPRPPAPTTPVPVDYPMEDDMAFLEKYDADADGKEDNWFVVRTDLTAKVSVTDNLALLQAQEVYKTIGLSARQLKAIPTVRA